MRLLSLWFNRFIYLFLARPNKWYQSNITGYFIAPSYMHFKEILLYSNNDTLSFEDVDANLLSKEKFDLEVHSDDKAEGLSIRGRSSENTDTGRWNFTSKWKGRKIQQILQIL